MPRKPLPGPSRLSQLLKHFQQEPIPTLPALRALRLTYALRNDHFGARHFVKDELPRIAYANPTLNIVVNRKEKKVQDTLVPEMLLEFRDGSRHKIDMEKKWSSAIFTELLDVHSKRGATINIPIDATGREGEHASRRRGGEKAVPPHLAAGSGSKRTSSSRNVSASP